MPKPLKPIWTAEGQKQRQAKRGKQAPLTKRAIKDALRKYEGLK